MNDEPEWAIWEATSGHVTLTTGERVLVRGGDELLIEEGPDGAIFHEHRPAVRH